MPTPVATAGSEAVAQTQAQASVRQGSWRAWLAAMRPQSLPLAVSPVLVGASLGFARGGHIDGVAAGGGGIHCATQQEPRG